MSTWRPLVLFPVSCYLWLTRFDDCFWQLFVGGACARLFIPVLMFVLYSYATDGVSGLEACHGESDHPEPMPWRAK